ncbi:MAG: hypothetical protein LBQ66_10090 [Planctomycetaceae bacterium]|jgi:hypothetical protein|nr:hypothetical protein [Planctomycetaceae bacterium]
MGNRPPGGNVKWLTDRWAFLVNNVASKSLLLSDIGAVYAPEFLSPKTKKR